MIDLDDIRQDIFDIKTVPKVLYVYRGDTFELDLDLTISSSELNTVVLNCDGLPEATALTLLESTAVSSKWHLVLNKTQTLILAPKTHNFTITIVRTDGTELTLYKGIMAVNNRVYSNYSNNYYIAALLKQTAPTALDNDYLIGTMWVNVLTNRVYFLTSVVNDEANWLDYSDQLDTHIEDFNNPHEVTAEQVDTYDKTTTDLKDANTLQEAKDYTYSQVEIDNKDTAIMNKVNNLENANMFKDVNYNNANCVLTFTKYDNTTKEIDLPLELLVESGYYDEVANELVLVLANGSEIRIFVGNLLTDLDAHNIRFNGSDTNYLTDKTEVESAIKELDTRVKANADRIDDVESGKQDKLIAGENITIDPNTNVISSKDERLEENVLLSTENDWDIEIIFTEKFPNSRNGWVQVDNEIYVFGGSDFLGGTDLDFSIEFAKKVYKYNVVTKQLTELSDFPIGTQELRGVYKDGFIYLIGQNVWSVSDLDKTYKYEISTDTYTLITNPPIRIRNSSGAVLVDNKIYVFVDGYYTDDSYVKINTTPYIYDISLDSWSVGQPTNLMFDRGYACYYNGLIYVQRSLKFQAYNPTTDTWITDLTPPTYGLVHTGVMQEFRGRLFIGSGWETAKAKNNPFIQYYDVAEDKWFVATRLEFKNHALGYGSMFLYDNKLYYIGGYSNEAEPNFNNVIRSFDLEKLQFEEIDYQRQLIGDIDTALTNLHTVFQNILGV